jgi:sensor histidine kinase YesM
MYTLLISEISSRSIFLYLITIIIHSETSHIIFSILLLLPMSYIQTFLSNFVIFALSSIKNRTTMLYSLPYLWICLSNRKPSGCQVTLINQLCLQRRSVLQMPCYFPAALKVVLCCRVYHTFIKINT